MPVRIPLSVFKSRPWPEQEPTWRDAKPALIEAALKRAVARPSGNWFVVGASREVTAGRPFGRTIAGREVVLWRGAGGELLAGPGSCPHLGAPLCDGAVHRGKVVCRWHGLALGGGKFGGWSPYPAHDDGVLVWVRLDEVGGEEPLPEPVLPVRPPAGAVAAVATVVGRCEPEDVVANRLDPWHGAWFHPYSFANLSVLETPTERDDKFLVEVTFRLAGRVGVPVVAAFTCPEPRTIVMHIVEGEGEGSVVETHATPLAPAPDGSARTAVVEATIAHSPRRGFAVARSAAPVLRPVMRWSAKRLWRDDLAYAERRYALRATGSFPG
jgi:phenylpropionate dioxygenase-like ring-hydroxylating dioxygenase large terminal subunit